MRKTFSAEPFFWMTLFGQHFVLEEKKNSKEKKKREKKRERERERKREREKERRRFLRSSTIFPFFFQFEKRCFTQFNETEREDCDD